MTLEKKHGNGDSPSREGNSNEDVFPIEKKTFQLVMLVLPLYHSITGSFTSQVAGSSSGTDHSSLFLDRVRRRLSSSAWMVFFVVSLTHPLGGPSQLVSSSYLPFIRHLGPFRRGNNPNEDVRGLPDQNVRMFHHYPSIKKKSLALE